MPKQVSAYTRSCLWNAPRQGEQGGEGERNCDVAATMLSYCGHAGYNGTAKMLEP